MITVARTNPYWSLHTHSRFSNNDALSDVGDTVVQAVKLGYPALGLQDHGNMAASVQLYQACKKHGIAAFPGTEFYTVPSIEQHKLDYANKEKKASRYHLGITAYNTKGYENLVWLNTLAHSQHFHKPLLDYASLASAAESGRLEGLACNTGCFFSWTVQQLITNGEQAAKQFITTLDTWFPGHTYVEMQNHNIVHGDGWDDDVVADALLGIADQLGLPAVVTQDSHYLHLEDKPAHETLKRLVAWGDQPDDAVFPGDGFHLADIAWMRAHHPKRLERGCEGLSHLLSSHAVSIPVLDSYQYSVPQLVNSPQTAMGKRCVNKLREWELPRRYEDRFIAELEVIKISEMAGYMLLTAEICDYMTAEGIRYQTRGSAAGSIVCWLLGITNVDPVKWDLRFERFLSKDRTKPPDIDLDIQHDKRQDVIAWLRTKYAVHQISTWAQYSLAGEEETTTGSLRVKYFASSAKRGGPTLWEDVPAEDKRALFDLADRGIYSGLGKNAAGVVITARETDFSKLVPLHHMSSGEPVAQYNKGDVESLGLVKLDVLGSKTLTVIERSLGLVGGLDLPEIPTNDTSTFSFIRSGRTDGIFQLEGHTTQRGLKQLRPTTVKHIIAAMALYRPAIMRSGATDAYCRRKNHEEITPVRHGLINAATKDTQGILLYQEQTMNLVRELGMTVEDLNKFLKAVKASNKDIEDAGRIIDEYMVWLEAECKKRGMTDGESVWVVDAVHGFAEYSFNRAHATVYGLTAYYCAYLAVHHPLEFHTALLAISTESTDKKADKERVYLRAARARGISIRQPDINSSGANYTLDHRFGVIRRGLTSIKGVGRVSAQELEAKQPYKDLDDLCDRTLPSKVSGGKDYRASRNPKDICGVIEKLMESGALESILDNG